MIVGVIVSLAVLLQYVATVLTIRLWRTAGRSPAWLVIAAVTLLMAVRRTISLYQLDFEDQPELASMLSELVGLGISVLMVVAIWLLGPLFASILRSREELRLRTHELDHRIRELNCLFRIADLVNQPDISLADVAQGAVRLMPGAWRFPEVACSRVLLDGHEYRTPNFRPAQWFQREPVVAGGEECGFVEVVYLEPRWSPGDVPFIEEEARLLKALAERLSKIVERYRFQEQLRLHREELAHVSRLSTMGEMASSLAHQLNQPLAAIANYLRGCQRRLRSGTGDQNDLLRAMDEAASQAERAGAIVRSLRDFVAKRGPHRVPNDINQIAETAVDLVSAEAKVLGVEIRFLPTEGLPPVLADAIQIEQVILNLVRNAVEAVSRGHGGGVVEIRTAAGPADMVAVSVRDNGPGLAAEAADKVFDSFFTTKPEGMGLGLPISRSIIEAHRGRLWVTANEDRGMTFHFTVPAGNGENTYDA